MSEPMFIISGVDSIKKMPNIIEKNEITLLFNVANVLRGDAPIQQANALLLSKAEKLF